MNRHLASFSEKQATIRSKIEALEDELDAIRRQAEADIQKDMRKEIEEAGYVFGFDTMARKGSIVLYTQAHPYDESICDQYYCRLYSLNVDIDYGDNSFGGDIIVNCSVILRVMEHNVPKYDTTGNRRQTYIFPLQEVRVRYKNIQDMKKKIPIVPQS